MSNFHQFVQDPLCGLFSKFADFSQPGVISSDGKTLLIDQGAFEAPANNGWIESVPFGGGPVKKLVRGAFPSWNE